MVKGELPVCRVKEWDRVRVRFCKKSYILMIFFKVYGCVIE
jgi:hypothetical protein